MMEIGIYAHTAQARLSGFFRSAFGKRCLRLAAGALAGFALSAGALAGTATPLALGLLCAAPPGALAVAIAVGGCAGYWLFWREAQGFAWMAAGLLAVAITGDRPITRQQKLLLPAVSAMLVSGCGVAFLLADLETPPVPVYLLQVFTAGLSTGIFHRWRSERNSVALWLICGIGTLALAQIVPLRYLCLGYLAAGILGVRCSFPGCALAGLGLDLAGITALPMTGVLALSFCLRLIPRQNRWLAPLAPAVSFLAISGICGRWDLLPLPGLLVGGIMGTLLPGNTLAPSNVQRKGVTGLAQVQLEQVALMLRRMEQALLLTPEPDLDRRAILRQAADMACDTCPERRQCKARHLVPALPEQLLEQPGLTPSDLPEGCRKAGRLMNELRRAQEQLRRVKGDRNRQASYRSALTDQYGFLAEYLESLADQLGQTRACPPPRFRPDVGVSSQGIEADNGDLCVWFSGTGNRFYLLLCDGMGTGFAAAQESRRAAELLRGLLEAGFPADYALRSFNALSVLRCAGGCATVDLVELDLTSGKGNIYKWGASPSYLMIAGQLKKIGTAGAPPGLSQQARETVDRLSLGRGEVLILLSDGAGEDALLHPGWTSPEQSPGEMAAAILERGRSAEDDATAAVIRLCPVTQ